MFRESKFFQIAEKLCKRFYDWERMSYNHGRVLHLPCWDAALNDPAGFVWRDFL